MHWDFDPRSPRGSGFQVSISHHQLRITWCVADTVIEELRADQRSLTVLAAHFKFSIDDHPLDVVASDGVSLSPVRGVHQLPIGVGQRVSGLFPHWLNGSLIRSDSTM